MEASERQARRAFERRFELLEQLAALITAWQGDCEALAAAVLAWQRDPELHELDEVLIAVPQALALELTTAGFAKRPQLHETLVDGARRCRGNPAFETAATRVPSPR